MKVYTYKSCGSCKKAIKWLQSKGVSFEEVPIRETPPTEEELRRMLDYQNGEIRKLFNTAGSDYRELQLKDQLSKMSASEAIALLASQGNLVKRPFLLGSSYGLVGFKEELWEAAGIC